MRKSVFVLAVIGAACSGVAFAAEAKKDKAHVPAVKATTMSDSEMDKVTAGVDPGFGVGTALSAGASPQILNAGLNAPQQAPVSSLNPSVIVAGGHITAGGPSNPFNPSNNAFRP